MKDFILNLTANIANLLEDVDFIDFLADVTWFLRRINLA